MSWNFFISYAREDGLSIALPLAEELKRRGWRVWIDAWQLGPGASISQRINEGLSLSHSAIMIISPEYLRKDYTKIEGNALIDLHVTDSKRIIPIAHHINLQEAKRLWPLISPLLSLSSDLGVATLCDSIVGTESTTASSRRYLDNFDFPRTVLERAIASLTTLQNPASWADLMSIRDMSRPDVWMGTNNESLVRLLYDLYLPLVIFRRQKYALERSFRTLHQDDQIRFMYLDFALYALTNEALIAACNPNLNYRPRVPGWRQRRIDQPDVYCWQGVTNEQIEGSESFFLKHYPALPVAGIDFEEFRASYDKCFIGSGEIQYALGILANALYDFAPSTRPVYWRLTFVWWTCYQAILSGATHGLEDLPRPPAFGIDAFRGSNGIKLREPLKISHEAAAEFFSVHCLPRLRVIRTS